MARLGGAFAPGTFPMAVQLAGGEVWYPPAGDYYIYPGGQTILQIWDQTNLIWRNLQNPVGTPYDISVDGYNFRMINWSGVVQGARITNAGSGGATNGIGSAVTGVTTTFGAAPSNGVAAAAYPIVGGQIGSTITIVNGGSGFVVPPVILIDPPPPGGIQATATCTISAGIINAVTVTNQGAGYISVPNVYVLPQYATYVGSGSPVNPAGAPTTVIPPGLIGGTFSQPPWFPNINWQMAVPVSTGASLTAGAITGSGTLTGIVLTNPGLGYTSGTIPTITIAGGSLAGGVAATAIMSMSLQSVAITAAGVAYTAGTAKFESTLGLLAAATQIINNNVVGPRMAQGQAVIGTTTVSSTVIEDPGFGFQAAPVIVTLQQAGTAATTVAQLTGTYGGVTDTFLVQPAINM